MANAEWRIANAEWRMRNAEQGNFIIVPILAENKPMLHLFEKMGFDIQKRSAQGVYELKAGFRGE